MIVRWVALVDENRTGYRNSEIARLRSTKPSVERTFLITACLLPGQSILRDPAKSAPGRTAESLTSLVPIDAVDSFHPGNDVNYCYVPDHGPAVFVT